MTTPGSNKPGSSSPVDDLDLMLRHDGELSAAERAAVDAAVNASMEAESDGAARAKLEALEQIGDMVRGRLELAADDAGPRLDALWAGIESSISRTVTDAATATATAPTGEPASAPRARVPRNDAGGGLMDGLRGWMDRWRSNMLTGAVCAAAAALVIMAVQRPGPGAGGGAIATGGTAQPNTPGPVVPAVNNPSQPPVQQTLAAQPPVVEDLEVIGGSATVLSIPGEEGENPTTVIWVTADDIVEDPI